MVINGRRLTIAEVPDDVGKASNHLCKIASNVLGKIKVIAKFV